MSEIDLERRLDELWHKRSEHKLPREEEQELERLFEELDRRYGRHTEKNPFFYEDYCERRATISCIELSMKHDNKGNVVDWMKDKSSK